MSGFNLQPTLISGFSDDVELGEIGEIKKSSRWSCASRVDGGLLAAHGVHWRGVALTKFDGKRWYNEPHEPTTLTLPETEAGFTSIPTTATAPQSRHADPLHGAARTHREHRAVLCQRSGKRARAIHGRSRQRPSASAAPIS